TYLKLDAKQNLWVVHPRGISKFDGTRFTNFLQPGSPVNSRRIRRVFELGDTLFLLSSPGYLGKIYRDSVHYWARPLKGGKRLVYSHEIPNHRMLLYANDSTFQIRGAEDSFELDHKRTFGHLT